MLNQKSFGTNWQMHLNMENFNQNITNKGWASMQTMLDKEMPLQRKRRRRSVLALLLLMLGTCLLTSAGWWTALHMQWIGPVVPADKVAMVVVHEQRENWKEDQRQVQIQNQVQTQVQEPAHIQVQVQGQYQTQTRDQYHPLKQVQTQSLVALPKSVDAENVFGNHINAPSLAQTEIASIVSGVIPTERLPLPLAPVVTTTWPGLKPPPARIDAAGIIAVIKPRHVRPITFGPTLGLASEQFSTINGATIGGSVNWHFAKHWGLRSSLLYSYLRPSPNTRPVASLRAQEYADATGNYNLLDTYGHLIDPQTGMSTATNKVYVPLQRLNRFEAPLMVYGQILKRLRLMAGPTMSYSLSVQADNKVYALDRVVSNNASERNADKVDALAADEIRRWQLGFQTGIGLRLGDRLEMDLLYRINSIRTYSRVLYDYDGSLLEYAPQRSAQINNLTIFTLNGIMFF
jgi:hypothetical protein